MSGQRPTTQRFDPNKALSCDQLLLKLAPIRSTRTNLPFSATSQMDQCERSRLRLGYLGGHREASFPDGLSDSTVGGLARLQRHFLLLYPCSSMSSSPHGSGRAIPDPVWSNFMKETAEKSRIWTSGSIWQLTFSALYY